MKGYYEAKSIESYVFTLNQIVNSPTNYSNLFSFS